MFGPPTHVHWPGALIWADACATVKLKAMAKITPKRFAIEFKRLLINRVSISGVCPLYVRTA
jgi:hypothetical protein